MILRPKECVGSYVDAPPRAGVMVESLRGLGYSTPSAIADIIDNSIASGSTMVEISFGYRGDDSFVMIIDNGSGMDRENLIKAMKMGAIDPLQERSPDDLGRFGLGLKTASFSQARTLTVSSVKDRQMNSFRWDLDFLANAADGSWPLMEGPFEDVNGLLERIQSLDHGTAVIWKKLDRIFTVGFNQQNFLDLIDRVERHLGMVFHRFISGSHLEIVISINGSPIEPWDPFMLDHPSTWSSPVEKLHSHSGPVEVQCHVLPHKDRLSQREFDAGGGPRGWTAHQGFYVYRNRRLLVPGHWLNLGNVSSWTQEEAYKLTRIRIDIPNTADHDWKIDVRKSAAAVPVSLRTRLKPLAEEARRRARQVFVNKGVASSKIVKGPIQQPWKIEHSSKGIKYRIDRDHAAVSSVIDQSDDQSRGSLLALLRVLEETVPVQRIWLDTAEGRELATGGFESVTMGELEAMITIFYRNMILKKGFSPKSARNILLKTEPFHLYPEVVNNLADDPDAMRSEDPL